MEEWGFGITRKELLLIVAEYVKENNLQTPFKDDMPGDEWFRNFKMCHYINIKKPQRQVRCLKRWKQQKNLKRQQNVPKTALPNTNSSCLEHSTALTNFPQPSTSQQDELIYQQNTLKPKLLFEELLHKKVKCPGQEPPLKVKKKRVPPGSKVITSAQVLAHLQEQQKIAEEKTTSKNLKYKIKSKRKPTKKLESDTSKEEYEQVPLIDSHEEIPRVPISVKSKITKSNKHHLKLKQKNGS
ncbi:hypothetical protein JTB14_029649 [Gonioctena quinquepunctata]|nr:hypothetical protein JTB14_029649 [Gonioctena quinquepunctata]